MDVTCTRRLEFDAAHRVMRHESKCRNLHGHRYAVELTARVVAGELDQLGRVVDFSVLKNVVGGWIDEHWDHGTILNKDDVDTAAFVDGKGWKLYLMEDNPTAEVMARFILDKANSLLSHADGLPRYGVRITHVRVYETPNCWADSRTVESREGLYSL
jgi:6-pyruvoyltetrahydropterin/6-carboxytetrahydropterin synthase